MSHKNPITALIVDDEPLARAYIRRLLEDDRDIAIVGECGDGKAAREFIEKNRPELIFLDVQMPEMDGFALLKALGADALPAVIFTTAFEQYAVRAFEFHALDYLLKPFDEPRFRRAVAVAKQRLAHPAEAAQENQQIGAMLRAAEEKSPFLERLLIKQNGRIVFLKTADVDLIKADDKYVQIYAGKTPYLVRQTLSQMKSALNPKVFVQIHRSAIVNTEKIKELQTTDGGDYLVVLGSGALVAVSRNFKDDLFDALGKLL